MEQNFDLFRWLSGNSRHVFLPQKLLCQYDPECDRGIDKTLGSISAVSPSVGFHFPEQRLIIEPNKSRCLCLAQIVILVLACVHRLTEGAPSPIFPEGRGVCTQAI